MKGIDRRENIGGMEVIKGGRRGLKAWLKGMRGRRKRKKRN